MGLDSPQRKKKMDVMRELCYERKSQNFQSLKKWDMSRAFKLLVHRKIVDEMDQSLQRKISQSSEYVRIVRQFFTDLLNQKVLVCDHKGIYDHSKNRYLSHAIENPELKMKINPFSRNVYPTPSRTLTKIYESQQHLKQTEKVKKLLEESLERIDSFLLQGEKQLMELRTRLELLVLEMQDCNMSTVHLCDELVGLYNSTKSVKPLMAQEDFFMSQQQFLLSAKKQLGCQRQLGEQIVEYWEVVVEKEKQKVELIKQIIGNYVNSSKNQRAPEHLSNLMDILSKNTERKYIEQYFSPQQLLTRELITQVANLEMKHDSQITEKFLKTFLKKYFFNNPNIRFEYQEFENRNLVLKTIKLFIKSKIDQSNSSLSQLQQQLAKTQQKDSSTVLEPIQVYVTVDGFIDIYKIVSFSSNGSLDEPWTENHSDYEGKEFLHSLKISHSLIFNRIADLQLNLNLKKWGLMSFSEPSEQELTLLFNSQDQRQEFIQFITQLR